jgi:hypothetical protein
MTYVRPDRLTDSEPEDKGKVDKTILDEEEDEMDTGNEGENKEPRSRQRSQENVNILGTNTGTEPGF